MNSGARGKRWMFAGAVLLALAGLAVAFVSWLRGGFDDGARPLTDAQIAAIMQQRQQELARWAWLKTADPRQMLRQDLKHRRYRVFEVCGYSCEVVGLDWRGADQCYPGVAREFVGIASDSLGGWRSEVQLKAYAVAAAYNPGMAAYLDAHGMRKCAKPPQAVGRG